MTEQLFLLGFDRDKSAFNARANHRTMNILITEFQTVRQATIAMIDSFDGNKDDRKSKRR
jgi:hypothetical protein